jgi:hypothetical protein
MNSGVTCLLPLWSGATVQVITALESWAKPIKDAALRAIESNQATPSGSQVCTTHLATPGCNFWG